jgi:putative transposase
VRRPRIKAEDGGYYHCMSRIIERRMILAEREKERLIGLMRSLAAFGGLNILSYCFMSNHFHILIHVPVRQSVSDEELLRRLLHIHTVQEVELIDKQLRGYREGGQDAMAEHLKARYTYRMYDVSEFFKAMKQRFSQYYNVREGRSGPLWEQRFKSVLVERSEHALLTMAAYIELNPLRAGLVTDPKDYRASSYGAAMGGCEEARNGLRLLLQVALGVEYVPWDEAQQIYRQHLYLQGQQKGLDPKGQPIRQGFTREEVEAVLAARGRLPMHELLRCRVRYFSDGLAFGGQEFVETVFRRHRGHFGPRRESGARPMRFGEWRGLCTLRDLRLTPVLRC